MVLKYRMEPIIFHLNHIKNMCKNMDCVECPFSVKRYGMDGLCFFMEIHEGRPPEIWDFSELKGDK